jgi:hypothetical protein
MNRKIKKILENVDEHYPDEGVLDSYFNASDARQSVIENAILAFITPVCEPFANIYSDPLDYLVDISNDSQIAKEVVRVLKEN